MASARQYSLDDVVVDVLRGTEAAVGFLGINEQHDHRHARGPGDGIHPPNLVQYGREHPPHGIDGDAAIRGPGDLLSRVREEETVDALRHVQEMRSELEMLVEPDVEAMEPRPLPDPRVDTAPWGRR